MFFAVMIESDVRLEQRYAAIKICILPESLLHISVIYPDEMFDQSEKLVRFTSVGMLHLEAKLGIPPWKVFPL